MFQPEFGAFSARYEAGEPSLVSLHLVADLETPVSAFLKLSRGRDGDLFLLESVEGGAARGRYSMIGLDPDVIFRVQGGRAEINRDALRDKQAFAPCGKKPLDALRALLDKSAIPAAANGSSGLPPMAAGVFGYLGYDMVREMERLAPAKPDPIGTPDALLVRPTLMAVFDSVRDEISLVTPVRPQAGVGAKAAYEAAIERLESVVAVLEGPLRHDGQPEDALLLQSHAPTSNTTEAQFLAMVEQAKSYIRAGDIFQVVLSQRFTSPFQLPAFALYRALRRVNPAPFLCYLDFGGFQIVCSSPEILVRARDGKVHDPPHRRHPLARRDPGAGRGAGAGTARRREGARRTPDAARPRPQRCRPRRGNRHGGGHRTIRHRALQPCHAHRLERRGQARSRA